jgi:hypothetical protein
VALTNARSGLFRLPVGALMSFGFFPIQIAIFCAVPMIGITVNYIVAKRADEEAGGAVYAGDVGRVGRRAFARRGLRLLRAHTPIESSAQHKALLRTSRPREIQMAKRGKFSLAVTALVLIFGTVLGAHLYGEWARTVWFATLQTRDWAMGSGLILLLLMPLGGGVRKRASAICWRTARWPWGKSCGGGTMTRIIRRRSMNSAIARGRRTRGWVSTTRRLFMRG